MDREYFPASLARRDETRGCVVEWSHAVGRFSPGDVPAGCGLGATAGHKNIPCGNVRTVRVFACIKVFSQLIMWAPPVSTGPAA
jgi:hypothetical protein